MKRFLIMFMVLGLMTGSVATAATKNHESARSGTVVIGASGLVSENLGCELAPDCRAWLESGCDPALAGRDPAAGASIEDVADLAARSTVWIFEHAPGAAASSKIQLWGENCTTISSSGSGPQPRNRRVLYIPASTKWMTVTGYMYNPWAVWLPVPNVSDPLTFDWTLKPFRRNR